jgi:hypothetical protein
MYDANRISVPVRHILISRLGGGGVLYCEKYCINIVLVFLGGVVVIVLAIGSKVRGLKPGRG